MITPPVPPASRFARLPHWCDRIGLAATFLCPLFLVHGRALAEAMIDIVAVLFLVRSALAADWRWTRAPWVGFACVWWLWLVLCSVPVLGLGAGGLRSLLQAVLTVRFGLFAAALQAWILVAAPRRRAMGWVLAVCFGYIALQLLLQAVVGVNLFGDHRFHDGTLTGPYDKPRAAAPLSRLLFPIVLVAVAWLTRRGAAGAAGAAGVLLASVALMVLAGQRMPLLLTGFGLLVSGFMLKRLRVPLLACLVAVPALVALSAVVSPRSFGHLVVLFEHQMEHFGTSPYGRILGRSIEIVEQDPLTGRGFDGFRTGCRLPRYFHGVPPLAPAASNGGGGAFCVQHAHNHYMQAATDSGLPGLVLFSLMVIAWLRALWPGTGGPGRESPEVAAWRTGLFVAVLIQEWPIASTSAFTNMPLGGWFFLLLAVGLAESGRARPGGLGHGWGWSRRRPAYIQARK